MKNEAVNELVHNIKQLSDFDASSFGIHSAVELIRYEIKNNNIDKIEEHLESIERSVDLISANTVRNYHAFEMLIHLVKALNN